MPCISSIGSTHHGFDKIEYKINRTPNVNSTRVMQLAWPNLLINQPDMKKNGSSPPKLWMLVTMPCNVFIPSWYEQLKRHDNGQKIFTFYVSLIQTAKTSMLDCGWLTLRPYRPNPPGARIGSSISRPCIDPLLCTTGKTRWFAWIWTVCPRRAQCSMMSCWAWTPGSMSSMCWAAMQRPWGNISQNSFWRLSGQRPNRPNSRPAVRIGHCQWRQMIAVAHTNRTVCPANRSKWHRQRSPPPPCRSSWWTVPHKNTKTAGSSPHRHHSPTAPQSGPLHLYRLPCPCNPI